MTTGAYGKSLAGTFRTDDQATFLSTVRGETFALTRLRRTKPIFERTVPLRPEHAFHFGYQLVERGNVELWTGSRLAFAGRFHADTLSMMDIALEPSSRADGLQDSLLFYVPRRVLDGLSADCGGGTVTELRHGPGISVVDPVVRHLGHSILPALSAPALASQLFFDFVALAFQEHVLHAYCNLRKRMKPIAARLAPWQERRALELVAARLGGDIGIEELAAECRLSRPHFVRAFKATFGLAPHRWLARRRIETSKAMMRETRLSLHDIARECGFAHQSHFGKVFRTVVGVSPAAWRHANGRFIVREPPGRNQ